MLVLKKIFKWSGAVFGLGIFFIVVWVGVFSIKAQVRESKSYKEAAPSEGQFVQVDGRDIYIQAKGPENGPVVLLIHGTGAWSGTWLKTQAALTEAGFRSIALDLPPFGFSERPETPTYSRVDQARRIIGVLDVLKIQKAIFVGHSFGGGPTVEAAVTAPDRVSALVLEDAALGLLTPGSNESSWLVDGFFGNKTIRNLVLASTVTNPLLTKSLLGTFVARPKEMPAEAVQTYQRPFVINNSTNDLGDWLDYFMRKSESSFSAETKNYQTLTMPTLIVWGKVDTITPINQAEHLNSIIPNSELRVIDGVGHIPHLETSEEFNSILIDFIFNLRQKTL